MIKNKKQFKNKFIDLSNKELNGEVTEEVFEKLGNSLKNIGFNLYAWNYSGVKIGLHIYVKICVSAPDFVSNHDCFRDYKEVSIYDIKGFGDKPTAKPKYNIEDLKGGLIAVHLPEPALFITAMKFFERSGMRLPVRYLSPDGQEWEAHREETCIMFDMCTGCIGKYSRLHCVANSYTIITLQDLDLGAKPTAEEEEFMKEQEKPQFSDSPVRMIDGKYYFGEQATDDDKMEVTLENDKVIIKYQGKEKVITRDDFDVEAVCAKFNEEIHLMSTKELAEGTRAWAFRMLEEGKKIKHKSWNNENYKIVGEEYEYVYMSGSAIFANGNDLSHPFNWWKDGWEIYKEQEEPNAQLTTINRWKNGKITEVLIEKHGKGEKTKICINIDNFKKIKNFLK